MDWLRILVPALVAAVVTMLLTPAVGRIAMRLRAVDEPGGRKRHSVRTPRLGGVAIVCGIAVALGLTWLLPMSRPLSGLALDEVLWFSVALLIIFAIGVKDDISGLGPWPKLLLQLLAASIVVAAGWQFTALRLPFEGRFAIGALAPVLSVIWIVGVTNAINFIDGLDGLAAGIVAIISGSLVVLAILVRSPATVVVASCIAGACLGFLRHNWRPARIYMGDSGSLTLGFLLATVSLHSSVKASAAVAMLVPVLALGLPVLDTLLVMWYRFLRGHQTMNRLARVFHGDREHLHYLLSDSHDKPPRATTLLYGLVLAFCLMALLVAASRSLGLGLGFLAIEFAVVLLIRTAGLRAKARRLADRRRDRLRRAEESDAEAHRGRAGVLEPGLESAKPAAKHATP